MRGGSERVGHSVTDGRTDEGLEQLRHSHPSTERMRFHCLVICLTVLMTDKWFGRNGRRTFLHLR